MKRIVASLVAWFLSASIALGASTINPNVPAQNAPLNSAPVRSNFLAAFNDINNILGVFAGVSPPATPTNLQSWADTSASPNYVFKYWNAQTGVWVPYGTLNVNTGTWSPYASASSFMATAPVAVSISGGVVTYSLNKNSNFATVSNNLALASIASGNVLANCGATTAEPTSCSWSSLLDRNVGTTNGLLPYRTGGVWGSVATGTSGHTLPFLDTLNTWSAMQTIYPGAGTLPAALTGAVFRAVNVDGTATVYEADSYGASSAFSCVRASGTLASKLTLSAGDQICSLSAHGYDGTAFSTSAAAVRMFASQTWTSSAHGTYVRISTTPNGSTSIAERVGVEQDGGLVVPPTVTGGSQGAGTINAAGLYWNGVALGTASLQNIGTTGANVPLLSTANTWGAAQTIPGIVVTGTFTATGLVKNTDLVNSSTTVNGQTCVLGGTCTISASAGTITVGVTTVASATANSILFNNGGTLGGITTGNNLVLGTNGSGVPSMTATLPSGVVNSSLTSVGTLTSGSLGAGFTTVALLRGGTGSTTASGARVNLNIEQITTQGNADTTIATTTRTIATTTTLTAPRTWTLPAANSLNPGQSIVVLDQAGAVNGANVLTVARAGADTINGASAAGITTQYGGLIAWTDGVSKWTTLSGGGGGGGGGVSLVGTDTTMIGGPIVTSGTLGVNPLTVRGYKSGLTLSTAGSSSTFGVTIGTATDSGDTTVMQLNSTLSKTTAAWAVGNAGALDTGTIANNTWYHAFLMQRPDTGVTDTCISTSVSGCTTGTNIPAAYTKFRRIGSMRTDGSSNWQAFSQVGNDFIWPVASQKTDINSNTLNTTPALFTLQVPTGLKVTAKIRGVATASTSLTITSPDEGAVAYNTPAGNQSANGTNTNTTITIDVRTNTSGQIQIVSAAPSGVFVAVTYGWTDNFGGPSGAGAAATAPSANVLQNYISGYTLSTAGGSSTFGVATGSATDATNATFIVLQSALSKTTGAWTVGSANGALDTGTIAANTWYHAFAIMRTDTSVVDVCVTLNVAGCATGGNIPANYTYQRRLGSMKTDSSSQWVAFVQDGNKFSLVTTVKDIDATNPGTSAVVRTLPSVPSGVRVEALVNAYVFSNTTDGVPYLYLSDLSTSDQAASGSNNIQSIAGDVNGGIGDQVSVLTNTSQQIRSRVLASGSSTIVRITVRGWIDTRNGPSLSGGGTGVQSVNYQGGSTVTLDPGSITNCALSGTVSGNALTVALKTQAGVDPSPGAPCAIGFRDASIATGGYSVVPVTAPTSFTTGTSGSTFGSVNTVAFRLWITAVNTGSGVVLGVSNQSSTSGVFALDEDNLVTTTACSACTNATSVGTVYTTAAQSAKPLRIIGYMEWGSGLTTVGTWASNPTKISMMTPGIRRPGEVVKTIYASFVAQTSSTSSSYVNSFLTASISLSSAANLVTSNYFSVGVIGNSGEAINSLMYQDGVAVGSVSQYSTTATGFNYASLNGLALNKPNKTTTSVYMVRFSNSSNVNTVYFGNNQTSVIQLQEIMG